MSIVSYYWDFGDQQSSEEATVDHRYSAQIYQFFPVLRIKNSDGFIADALIEIQGDELAPLTKEIINKTFPVNQYLLIAGGLIIILIIIRKFLI